MERKMANDSLCKEERILNTINVVSAWIYSAELRNLISLFDDGRETLNRLGKEDLKKDAAVLVEFANTHWDFRKGRERWALEDTPFLQENKDYIMEQMEPLGFKGSETSIPHCNPDYILPLGGARAANHIRTKFARRLVDKYDWSDKKIVALSGVRPISDVEIPYLREYGVCPDGSFTEFDAICSGLESAFYLEQYAEEKIDHGNINLSSVVRRYEDAYNGCKVSALAAPSSNPYRRANSLDTFQWFLEKFDVKKGESILLVTNPIYVPYQLLKFTELSIENEISVECVGADFEGEHSVNKVSSYLQEVGATINAIYELVRKYA